MDPVLMPVWPNGGRLIGVGRTTMFQLVADGKIATVKCGRKRLVTPDELRRFARSLAANSAA